MGEAAEQLMKNLLKVMNNQVLLQALENQDVSGWLPKALSSQRNRA